MSRKLGLKTLQPSRVSFVLADKMTRKPEGRLVNISVKIGGCWILTDFVVLNLDDNEQDLILGRSFLATIGASINVPKGKATLRLEKTVMKFYVEKMDKQPTIDGQTFLIEESDAIENVQSMDTSPVKFLVDKDFSYKDEIGFKVGEGESLARILETITTSKPIIDAERHGPEEEVSITLMDPAQI